MVAAAVILPERFDLPGLDDSKKVSPALRERLFAGIRSQATVGLAIVDAAEIDESYNFV